MLWLGLGWEARAGCAFVPDGWSVDPGYARSLKGRGFRRIVTV